MNSAIHSTAWAILALHSLLDDPTSDANFVAAEKWLATQQNDLLGGTGGFSSSVKGQDANVVDTALAIQALSVAPASAGWDAAHEDLARNFLQTHQNDVGGFSYMSPTGSTQTDATSAAIQAIITLGENPRNWTGAVKGNPYTALNTLIQTNGSYRQTDRLGLIGTTSWALVAQDVKSQTFTIYPKKIDPALKSFRFRPAVQLDLAQERRQVQDPHRPDPGDVHGPQGRHRHQSVRLPSVRRQQEPQPRGRHRQVRAAPAAQERAQRRPHLRDPAA